ncbi:MAG: NAD-dependent epimerase/dehydratase family protein [Flavobacterium sp.]|nr:NAD-dependent epimerase/dehydratase family protein [Flavobacterium sp.]
MNKTILITGGCGFIGSNLAINLKIKYPAYKIICLDNLKRRGSELNISRLKEVNIDFIHADIRNKEDLIIDETIDFIIDAAAEPSIMAGLDANFNYVINTNLVGTINTLEIAAKHKAKFIFLSTSRVYPISFIEQINIDETETRYIISNNQTLEGISVNGISENFPLTKARSVYGTTKLASELIIEEFREFFGVDYVINRCGVVAGPYQMGKIDQGVIALWAARHYWKKEVSYFGYKGLGKQVRDVLHILDLFDLIDIQIHNFKNVSGNTYNAGGSNFSSVSLKELTNICQKITGNIIKENGIDVHRNGDIPIYITDNFKITSATGWKPKRNAEKIVDDIITWIGNNEQQLDKILNV